MKLKKFFNKTIIIICPNIDDIYEFIDDIMIIDEGKILLSGNKYEIYNGKSKYGVIYVHKIIPQITFSKLCSFRTIGHQIYPRTGAQHGFFYQEEDARMPVEKCVIPYFFRHDSKCSEIIFNMMKQGEFLFPTDDLSSYSNEIRHSNSVTGQAFCNNLYTNQDDMRVNMRRLKELGIKVDWHNRRVFTIDTLNQYYENIRNGWWAKTPTNHKLTCCISTTCRKHRMIVRRRHSGESLRRKSRDFHCKARVSLALL